MKYLLKNMIRPFYYYIKNSHEREFVRLYSKWGGVKRYEKFNNVKFLKYNFDIPDLQSFIWQFKEIFVDEIYRFKTNTKKPIIYDCGANIGTSCLYFKEIFKSAKIKAFEADPMIADILKTNMNKNNIDNIEIINSAVWINEDGIEFGSEGADGGSVYANNNRIKTKSIRLKDLINEDSVDLLKMDIEGSEYDVLKDCSDSLKNVRNIFVEYHSWNYKNQKLSEILEILENNNFRYYIESIAKRKHPFINRHLDSNMDLQLNIFGYRA
ncbi:FkbM family methyltransferase [Campylobacter sp. 9BO]|uniref:FkbM family methyltransferase n=1 Tax=Campylobacter sp. 9BO TaxID=3424759 RepID=UPI003D353B15